VPLLFFSVCGKSIHGASFDMIHYAGPRWNVAKLSFKVINVFSKKEHMTLK
jgi:hypothetical protein